MQFTKYHGLGNDFVVVDARREPGLAGDATAAIAVCDRHMGIGADGLVLLLESEMADYRMHIFNSDGSVAKMCGNGIRCFSRFAYENGLWDGRGELRVETASGLRTTRLMARGHGAFLVAVNMQAPRLDPADVPTTLRAEAGGETLAVLDAPLVVDGETHRVSCLSMGNPHAVLFVPKLEEAPIEQLGPRIEAHPAFPDKTNVHFVEVIDGATLRMRTWERGAGLTLACGTGACAATVAAALTERAGRETTVHVPGGRLHIEWRRDTDDVIMTGPAARVFEGLLAAELLGERVRA